MNFSTSTVSTPRSFLHRPVRSGDQPISQSTEKSSAQAPSAQFSFSTTPLPREACWTPAGRLGSPTYTLVQRNFEVFPTTSVATPAVVIPPPSEKTYQTFLGDVVLNLSPTTISIDSARVQNYTAELKSLRNTPKKDSGHATIFACLTLGKN